MCDKRQMALHLVFVAPEAAAPAPQKVAKSDPRQVDLEEWLDSRPAGERVE
jgi:hypothetical protein